MSSAHSHAYLLNTQDAPKSFDNLALDGKNRWHEIIYTAVKRGRVWLEVKEKKKLKQNSACSYSCCWQRQADRLTKDVRPERERTWRPERPPRSSSHKVCVILALFMTYCLCLCGVRQALKRYWTSHGTIAHSLMHTRAHTHISWGSNTSFFHFDLV